MPLAYAHMMQFFVDTICCLYPFVAVYEVNTIIIESTGAYKQLVLATRTSDSY